MGKGWNPKWDEYAPKLDTYMYGLLVMLPRRENSKTSSKGGSRPLSSMFNHPPNPSDGYRGERMKQTHKKIPGPGEDFTRRPSMVRASTFSAKRRTYQYPAGSANV